MLRFEKSVCPTCRGPAVKIREIVQVDCHLEQNDDGSYGYSESLSSTVHWDSSKPELNDDRYSLACANRHSWTSAAA